MLAVPLQPRRHAERRVRRAVPLQGERRGRAMRPMQARFGAQNVTLHTQIIFKTWKWNFGHHRVFKCGIGISDQCKHKNSRLLRTTRGQRQGVPPVLLLRNHERVQGGRAGRRGDSHLLSFPTVNLQTDPSDYEIALDEFCLTLCIRNGHIPSSKQHVKLKATETPPQPDGSDCIAVLRSSSTPRDG